MSRTPKQNMKTIFNDRRLLCRRRDAHFLAAYAVELRAVQLDDGTVKGGALADEMRLISEKIRRLAKDFDSLATTIAQAKIK